MGSFEATLLPDGARVLTHCNAGALATAGHGTVLGVIFSPTTEKINHELILINSILLY